MKSATKMLLNRTHQEIWHRGESYADKDLVGIVNDTDKKVQAVVKGTKEYDIILRFSPRKILINCTCPYFKKNGHICKHIVAVAIVWDEKRGISRPSLDVVERGTVPPSGFSRKDINRLFSKPLKADLDELRILPEVTALGGYVRPHSKLPKEPKIISDASNPLTTKELQNCYSQIKKWSHRQAYDPYFCSGEMVAAFCAMLRIIRKRLPVTPALVAVELLLSIQQFNITLVTELVDDSQGLHRFSEAHLDDIYDYLKTLSIDKGEQNQFEAFLTQFEEIRGVY